MPMLARIRLLMVSVSSCLLLGDPTAALGQDLTVSAIEVNQAVQYGTTPLVGNQTTIVRVTINTGGLNIANVDAVLRMSVNNAPVAGPPIFSINGPITAPSVPSSADINNTLNFLVLPPVSNDVDFTVEVNPNRNVVETNYNNNTLTLTNRVFICRGMVEFPYVPINYTFEGPGLPPANLMEPGIGDGFVRAIFTAEWNYHKAPITPPVFTTNIDNSSAALQNLLNDIRENQLPALGNPEAGLIYGWLAGNPFGGNGQANAIPGTSAFGNTDTTRHQRTCAHELGHCFGLVHNSTLIDTYGFDEEHHLWNTQSLPQVFPTNKNDIMVAGLLTNQAWVASNSYNVALNDARVACGVGNDENDAPAGIPPVPVLRVSGSILHDIRQVELNPVTRIRRGRIDQTNPNGDIVIEALNAAGQSLWSIGYRTDTARELCTTDKFGRPMFDPSGSFHVLIPETVGGQTIHQVRIVNAADGNVLASRVRSANPPQVTFIGVTRLGDVIGGNDDQQARITGRVRVQWSAIDPDGDPLQSTLTFTPDNGLSWYPVVVNTSANLFEFESSDIPASEGNNGRFAVVVTDGLNVGEDESTALAFGPGSPPETFLLTPNTGNTFPRYAPIAFHGTSWDKENLLLNGANMVWTSSLDGQIGTGRLFIKSNLSVGTHLITLTGTDLNGNSTSKNITITITARTVISPDCNGNFVFDLVDIQNATSLDTNLNGIPDECEQLCVADIVPNGVVNVEDLLAVIAAWGPCANPSNCSADIAPVGPPLGDDLVNVQDLLAVIAEWGDCP